MKKLVFDVDKYREVMRGHGGISESFIDICVESWGNRCQGLTVKEIDEIGYVVTPRWLIEVEEDTDEE